MADVEETGKVVGLIHRVISVLIIVACIIAFIFGIHWLFLSIFVVFAILLYFAATRFVGGIRTNNSRQTIFFIIMSVFLLIICAYYLYLLIAGLITGHFFEDSVYIFIPSPIIFLFQLFTVYVSSKVRLSIIKRTEGLQLNA